MFRDPRCVFIADSLGLAEVVVLWLKENGFDAEAMSTATLGGLEGLTWMSNTAISARGIEVWVKDSDQANQARTELEDHLSALKLQAAGTARESVEVHCEECGHTTSFSGEFRGKSKIATDVVTIWMSRGMKKNGWMSTKGSRMKVDRSPNRPQWGRSR